MKTQYFVIVRIFVTTAPVLFTTDLKADDRPVRANSITRSDGRYFTTERVIMGQRISTLLLLSFIAGLILLSCAPGVRGVDGNTIIDDEKGISLTFPGVYDVNLNYNHPHRMFAAASQEFSGAGFKMPTYQLFYFESDAELQSVESVLGEMLQEPAELYFSYDVSNTVNTELGGRPGKIVYFSSTSTLTSPESKNLGATLYLKNDQGYIVLHHVVYENWFREDLFNQIITENLRFVN